MVRIAEALDFTPDKMRRWRLPPPGWTLTLCECDARVDGALSLAWKSEEADPVMTLRACSLHRRVTLLRRLRDET